MLLFQGTLLQLHTNQIPLYFVLGFILFFLDTIAFDTIHYILHVFINSRFKFLNTIGNLHQAHHDFWDHELKFHDDKTQVNTFFHVIPEGLTQVLVASLAFFILPPIIVIIVMAIHLSITLSVLLIFKGKDANHRPYIKLPAPAPGNPLVMAPYHSLHHVFPDEYMSSYTPIFDIIFATGCSLKNRKVLITGASGSFAKPLIELLGKQNVASIEKVHFKKDWDYDNYDSLEAKMENIDILILAHGSKEINAMQANCDSFVTIIELFKKVTKERRFPPEI